MTRAWIIAVTVWREVLRRKDVYVLAVLLLALLCALLSANVFGLGANVRYVMDLGLMMAWLFSIVLGVGVSCRQLPDEERRGTIYPLLAKPVARGELLAGKWLGAWSVVSCATAAFYLLVAGVVAWEGALFGWETIGQAFFLHIAGLSWVVALGIAFSTRMTFAAAASVSYVVLGASFFVVPRVPEIIGEGGGFDATLLLVSYYLFPHFELFDMRMRVVHEWGTIPLKTAAILAAYGAILTALFLFLAWLGYRAKHFLRGELS